VLVPSAYPLGLGRKPSSFRDATGQNEPQRETQRTPTWEDFNTTREQPYRRECIQDFRGGMREFRHLQRSRGGRTKTRALHQFSCLFTGFTESMVSSLFKRFGVLEQSRSVGRPPNGGGQGEQGPYWDLVKEITITFGSAPTFIIGRISQPAAGDQYAEFPMVLRGIRWVARKRT